jgi:hypothetical protein
VQLEVLFPPRAGTAQYGAVQTYLFSNPAVTGTVLEVQWSDFDLGNDATGTHTAYDFSIPDQAIAPWVAAGKQANLVLQNTTYGGDNCPASGSGSRGLSGVGNCAMPPWVWTALTPASIASCTTSPGTPQQAPDFRSPRFRTPYQAAIAALIAHYSTNPGVGYIRIGLGKGGEINLPSGWNDTRTACGQAYTTAWGYTVGDTAAFTWNAYLQDMLSFEASLRSPKQLLVSITPVVTPGVTGATVPDFLAPIAVANRIGIGNQGLQSSDLANFPTCSGDWCGLFERFVGAVPLELQTYGTSCPAGVGSCPADALSNATGSLAPLLPFAVTHHATIVEIYAEDWLIAYDPLDPSYGRYGASYRQAIEAAADAP